MEKNDTPALFTKTYWKSWLRRFLTLLAPAFLMCFTVVFFGPLDIVNANVAYLTFTAGDLAPTLALALVGFSAAIAGVFAFVPGKAHGVALAVLLAIALLFYLQGIVLNGDLGTLDGSSFDWRNEPEAAHTNLAIWLSVMAVFAILGWFFPEGMRLAGFIACAALVAAQGMSLITTWVPADRSTPNYQLSGDEQFMMSADENIIVITLDQFSPLIFEQALEDDPHFKETFKDFLYFDNMSSVYSFTFPSLMYLMTHQYLDTTVPTREAVANAWHSDTANGFYDALHRNGYKVNLYMESNYAALGTENMMGKADNIVEAGSLVITPMLFEFIEDMSLYRYMPTRLKNSFCVSTGGIVDISTYQGVGKLRINYDFLSSLRDEGLTLTDDHKVFNWYHMAGAHFPYVVGYDGMWLGEREGEEARNDQLHGYLLAVEEFLDRLKAIGVYDDATIIISADHGYFECFQAVCMVKMPGETRDEFTTTSAPVAQEDIMPTILYALGEDYSGYGTTVFDWNEGDYRVRTTSVWGYMAQYPNVEWIGNLDQWDAEANGFERYNVLGVFHYVGDRDTIFNKERYWYEYGYADEIQPLYDSFY